MTIATIAALVLCFAPPFEAVVVSVYDGDTITVRTDETIKIRINGIDAPELKQPFGQASKQAMSSLVFGKTVTVKPDKKDRYGRLLARVEIAGKDTSIKMVETGMAHWYQQYAKHDTELQSAQTKAKSAKLGVWSVPDAIAPWEYRKQKKAVTK
ncbi:COG1525 Micrococcal nuclease (thermonuclease) homologs [uncultured Caudovirales phage]|uniref:COG1525 Micrococcal nuclease (Thermonuclease) homologs n=1 Tax=uncultured Caudovirales phage TaxID=2100421 RepID=A0A6J5SYH8_9CAUD|nr:COG1525 Micrococcal nuclease (thermonuclease) homologs [uncultured Caudovirales phage]CAB4219724.1 COG1525 Micrococcal nuclease (thermonuclease) homologs [uncultured Caudovirales phage]